jgi:gamma-glutamylcyclotransferase (GGCT)/AIG2-like uncharacterized protein YtfP
MRRILLFSYGTLLEEKIQRRVFGRLVTGPAGRLEGWHVAPRAVRGRYPGIVRANGEGTTGRVLELAPGDLARADAYEDTPVLYRRLRVSVKVGRRAVRCWIYAPATGHAAGVAPDRRPVFPRRH